MAATPENKIKQMIKDVLAQFEDTRMRDSGVPGLGMTPTPELYQYWPVPAGFGSSSLDCIVSYYGRAIFIEAKAPGKKPTPRQLLTMAQCEGSGAIVFVIDGKDGCDKLRDTLLLIRLSHANNC